MLSDLQIDKLIHNKNYKDVIIHYLDRLDNLIKTNEVNELDNIEPTEYIKTISNLSYVYYLDNNYNEAIGVLSNVLSKDRGLTWYKIYYRAAKAYEGLLDYDNMVKSFELMVKSFEQIHGNINNITPDSTIFKDPCIQSYYNKDVNFLKQWIISKGGYIPNLTIEYYDVDYRGAKTTCSVKKHNPIIKVPFECMISLENAKRNNPYVIQLLNKRLSDHSYFALELLTFKKNKTMEPYMRCLPKYFNNVPINFSIEELKYLYGSYALNKIIQKIHLIKLDYDLIMATISDLPFTFEEFVWARTVIITRIYAITNNNVKDTVMVPIADMANHVMTPNTTWKFDHECNMFVVSAEHNLEQNEVIYETYGFKSNYRYFVNYGFTVENNEHAQLALVLNPELQRLYTGFIDITLKNADPSLKIIDVIIQEYDGKIFKLFLDQILKEQNIFQIGYFYNDEIHKLFTKLRPEGLSQKEAEMHVMNTIEDALLRSNSLFNSTLEDDLLLLKTYEYSFNIKNCLIMRIEEKKLIKFWLEFVIIIKDILINNHNIKKLKPRFFTSYSQCELAYCIAFSMRAFMRRIISRASSRRPAEMSALSSICAVMPAPRGA